MMQQIVHGPTRQDFIRQAEEAEARLSPEQKQIKAEAKERRALLNANANVEVDCSPEEAEMLKHFLYDHTKLVKYDSKANKLFWFGYADEMAIGVTDLIPQFAKRMAYVRTQVKAHVEATQKQAQQRVEFELSSQAYRKETLERVERELTEAMNDQILQAELKRRPARVFSGDEKSKLIDCQAYNQDDLTRSRENVVKSKTDCLKKIRNDEKAINKLQTECKPYDTEIAELTTQQQMDDIDEAKFKDLDSSIRFRQSKLRKLRDKIEVHEKAKKEHQAVLDKLEYQQNVLDLAIDMNALKRDFFNWQTRCGRVIQRNEKLMRELSELEILKQNLDEKWKAETGDNQDLCSPLLRTERKLFII